MLLQHPIPSIHLLQMISAPDDPPFSIRDYVYAARHNNHIENSWPFSLHHLRQPIPTHHINSLLPPFQPLHSVRNICRRPLHTSKHNSSHSFQQPTSPISESPNISHSSSFTCSNNNTTFAVEPPRRKCRFILRLGSTSHHPTQTEDILPPISDSMASKLCPVCKTFSSPSNTTLNAHIDQCLAIQPNSSQLTTHTKFTNHLINPIKKRSMLDIYATALPCTLEELDRRNGSNWAGNLSLPPTDEQVQGLSGVERKHACHNEGPVYFDSNGTKLRIISAFTNESIPPTRDEPSRDCQFIVHNVKQHFRTKITKTVRPKARHRPLCSLKSNENELFGAQGTTHEMEKSSENNLSNPSQLMETRDGIEGSEPRTLQQWACSKRRHHLKRISGKDSCPGVGSSSHLSMKPLIERNKKNFNNSSVRGSFPTRTSSNYAVPSTNILCADSPFHESQVTGLRVDTYSGPESEKNMLTNMISSSPHGTCSFKFPTCTGMFTTSPKSMRLEVSDHTADSSVNVAKNLSTEWVVKTSPTELVVELNGQQSSVKKPRMRRLRAGTKLPVGVRPLDSQPDSVPGAENRLRRCWLGITSDSDESSDKLMPEVEGLNDQLTFGGLEALDSRRGRGASVFSEWGKPAASSSGVETRYCDVSAESHVGASFKKFYSTASMDNFDSHEKGSAESPVIETFSTKTFASKFRCFSDSLDSQTSSSQSTGEHESYAWETEEPVSFVQSKLLEAQGANRANEVCRIKEVTDMASDVTSQVVGISSFEGQWRRFRTNPPSAPSGSAFPSLRDMNAVDLHQNLSLTSTNILFAQDRHMVVDSHSSESPVSAISTISPHSMTRSDSQFSDPESCGRPFAVEDRLILGFSGGQTESVVIEAGINLERKKFRATKIDLPVEPVNFRDDRPCCCKLRTTFPSKVHQGSDHVKEQTWESSILHNKWKPMAYSTNVQPKYFVERDFVSVSRCRDMVNPLCELSRVSFSKHSSPEVVERLTSHADFRHRCTYPQVKNGKLTPNPVLRLMGKNLMVVNQEVDTLRQPTSDSANTCAYESPSQRLS